MPMAGMPALLECPIARGDGDAGTRGAEDYGYVLSNQVGGPRWGALSLDSRYPLLPALRCRSRQLISTVAVPIGVLNAKGLLLAACAVVAKAGPNTPIFTTLRRLRARRPRYPQRAPGCRRAGKNMLLRESASTAIRSRAMSFFMIFPPFIFLFLFMAYMLYA